MSGPIVRKYGFPNFDQIFGKRELQHGVDEPEPQTEAVKPNAPPSEEPTNEKPTRAAKKAK
jgi:hypothetical protein